VKLLTGNTPVKRQNAPVTQIAASSGVADRIPPRARILSAARELFYRHGIRPVGVEAIAEAAGTNKMTLYRHFPSKDELIAECLRQFASEADGVWERLEAEHPGDPAAQLRGWLAAVARRISDPQDRGCALANAAIEIADKDHPARRVIEAFKSAQRDRLAMLARSAGAAEPDVLADNLFMLLEGARICAQSTGPKGPACQFVKTGEGLIAAQLR
jgi:AcrR family transcriptional regulator